MMREDRAIAQELAARAAPDDYTLLLSTSAGLVITPQVTQAPHDAFRDFAPLSKVVISGQVNLMFNSMSAVWPHARTGNLRALAYAGAKRALAAPEVPTMAESIPGFQVAAWYTLATTAGTPTTITIIAKLNADMVSMLADPLFAKRLIEFAQDPQSSTPAELTAFMRSESTRWAGVLQAAGMLPAR